MNILKNSDNQIRSGWKIAMVYVSYFILTIILTTLVTFIYSIIYLAINPQYMNNPGELAQRISEEFSSFSSGIGTIIKCIDCLSMIFCVILFWKLLDKKKVNELGFTNIKHSYKDLIFGLILGALSFTIIAATLVLTGSVEVTNVLSKPAFSMNLILELLMFVLVGINEELFCRGYCITVLKQSKRAWVPVIVSSIIFSLMHSLNAGISMLAYINLFLYAITMDIFLSKLKIYGWE